MNIVLNIIFLGVTLLGFSCGEDDTTEKTAAVNAEYLGTWEVECTDGGSDSYSYVFTAAMVTWSTKHYNAEASDCEDEHLDFEAEMSGSYEIGEEVEDVDDAKNLNITISTFTLTPRSTAANDFFIEAEFCGIGDWELGKATDLSAEDCDDVGNTKEGNKTYDIIKVTDTQLQAGDVGDDEEYDGSSEEKRPIALDTDLIYERQ